MNVLLVGGSGMVGSMTLPFLKDELQLRVFDRVSPASEDVEYLQGDVKDPAAVAKAVEGMDAVIYMVMQPLDQYEDVQLCYDLNVTGLYQVLHCAHKNGIRRAVYISSGSVYDYRYDFYHSEDMPFDAPDEYGITKWFGERVSEWFCRCHGMTICSLRLFSPRTRSDWLEVRRDEMTFRAAGTQDSDVARAILLALECPITGFHPVFISGDHEGKHINLSRARELLGWEPLARPDETG